VDDGEFVTSKYRDLDDYALELSFDSAIELEKLKGMDATPEGVIAAANLFAKWFREQRPSAE